MEKSVILFDGVCNLCNSFVNWVIRHDRRNRFVFASLQSEAASLLMKEAVGLKNSRTIILLENGKKYNRSTAALRILRGLGRKWKLLYVFIIIPRFIRDAVYNFIAGNRYQWFGKTQNCIFPTPGLENKFLNREKK